jgi:tetratricopeptide (TPR) repeat protein
MRAIRVVACFATFAALVTGQPLPSERLRQERIRKYEEITAQNPRDVEMWHELAGLYREAELWDKAIVAETQAVERHPKYAAAFYGRGKAKMEKQDYAGAVEDFSSSIRLFEARGGLEIYLKLEQPSDIYIDSYRCRGVAKAHLKQVNAGISDVSTALKLRNDDPKLLYDRGYLEEKAGRKKEAIADYERAGLVFADGYGRQSAQECVARLEHLGAKTEAAAIKRKLEPKKAKSDLP